MKYVVEYDRDSGEFTDMYGGKWAATGCELIDFEPYKEVKGADELVKLKDAGFTAEEIMQMKREGLI